MEGYSGYACPVSCTRNGSERVYARLLPRQAAAEEGIWIVSYTRDEEGGEKKKFLRLGSVQEALSLRIVKIADSGGGNEGMNDNTLNESFAEVFLRNPIHVFAHLLFLGSSLLNLTDMSDYLIL